MDVRAPLVETSSVEYFVPTRHLHSTTSQALHFKSAASRPQAKHFNVTA